MDIYFHGECIIKTGIAIPKGANKVSAKNGRYIVANSETTGNHHCVKEHEGVELFENNGVLYLKNSVVAELFCVDTNRHDTESIPPGVWEINRANEYDYLADMTRKVSD